MLFIYKDKKIKIMNSHQLLTLLGATVAFCFSFHYPPSRSCIYGYIKEPNKM